MYYLTTRSMRRRTWEWRGAEPRRTFYCGDVARRDPFGRAPSLCQRRGV